MENKDFPPQEDSGFSPEDMNEIPTEEFAAEEPFSEEEPIAEEPLTESPEAGDEITADEHAMAMHGMLAPGEPESQFDIGILDDPELAILMDEEPENTEEPEVPQEPDRKKNQSTPRKGRPKRRNREILFGLPGVAASLIWLGIILAVGVTLGRLVWVCAADVLAFGRESQPVTVTVYQTDTIETIADKLHQGGLIKYPGLFKLYAGFAVDEGEIQPGIWDLNTLYDYHALVKKMSVSSSREVVEITIPEGYSCRQIFSLLEENKVATAQDLGSWAASGELNEYWFLENISRSDKYSLEGFLFPDTYEFYKNSSPREALERLLNNFDHRFTEEMREQIDSLNDHFSEMMRSDGRSEEYIAAHRFDVRDVVIVASLIEKETSGDEESRSIASVIYNRLFSWGDNPPYLNIDASIIYALDGKTDLTSDDLRVDSPYNTYRNTGLTPGAITNPGLSSLKAALNPASTNYYFYVLDPAEGSHHFSTTYEEHQDFIASLE